MNEEDRTVITIRSSLSFSIERYRLIPDPGMQRKVDLVARCALEQTSNELLRNSILKTSKVIFANNQAVNAEDDEGGFLIPLSYEQIDSYEV